MESINIIQDPKLEVMLLSLLVGESKMELNIGLVLTCGAQLGEKMDTSELLKDNVILKNLPLVAFLSLNQQINSSNEKITFVKKLNFLKSYLSFL